MLPVGESFIQLTEELATNNELLSSESEAIRKLIGKTNLYTKYEEEKTYVFHH